MLLEITKAVELGQSVDAVWDVVQDPASVASCIPSVRGFTRQADEPSYRASIEDRLGPFTVVVPVTIEVTADAATRRITARIAGHDERGQARVRGEVAAVVLPAPGGSRLELTSRIEVLGRLAALGAVPMRRRADQIFDVFVRNLSTLLGGADGRAIG